MLIHIMFGICLYINQLNKSINKTSSLADSNAAIVASKMDKATYITLPLTAPNRIIPPSSSRKAKAPLHSLPCPLASL